jgi:hypothetical protein
MLLIEDARHIGAGFTQKPLVFGVLKTSKVFMTFGTVPG